MMQRAVPAAGSKLPTRRGALIAALGCCAAMPGAVAATDNTAFSTNFAGLALLDQEGRRFGFASLAGRVLLVNFVFTGCSTVCPIQTRLLADVLTSQPRGGPGAAVHFVSVSLDPLQDTPAALRAFGKAMGADFARWSFVTGRVDDIERISERLRLFRPGTAVRRPDDHATTLWLVGADGQLRLRLQGNPPDPKRVAAELSGLRSLRA